MLTHKIVTWLALSPNSELADDALSAELGHSSSPSAFLSSSSSFRIVSGREFSFGFS
jgi:hypothetical protein